MYLPMCYFAARDVIIYFAVNFVYWYGFALFMWHCLYSWNKTRMPMQEAQDTIENLSYSNVMFLLITYVMTDCKFDHESIIRKLWQLLLFGGYIMLVNHLFSFVEAVIKIKKIFVLYHIKKVEFENVMKYFKLVKNFNFY